MRNKYSTVVLNITVDYSYDYNLRGEIGNGDN